MKNKIKLIVIAIAVIALLITAFFIWFCGPYATDKGGTGAWKPGYLSPRQYYEENGKNLKGTTKTIDSISYTFDDLGTVIQNENDGKWVNSVNYQLSSGVELKRTWYEINDDLYCFDDEGKVIKDDLIKVNNMQYALDEEGALRKTYFKLWGHTFGTNKDGAIIENGYFYSDGSEGGFGSLYGSNHRGHAHEINTVAMQFPGPPYVIWKSMEYYKSEPAYFFEKDYVLVGETMHTTDTSNQRDGESGTLVTEGSQIYTKGSTLEQIYIYDKTDNSFYEYVLSE